MFVSARAHVYAVALLQAARSQGIEEDVGRVLASLVLGHDDLSAIVLGAHAPARFASLCDRHSHQALEAFLAKDMSPASRLLGRLIVQLLIRKRVTLLPQIAHDYYVRVCAGRGTTPAIIRAAHPLSPDQIKTIGTIVHQARGVTPEFTFQHTPSVIAGFEVVCGDWRFDATLHGRLTRIRTRIHATLSTQKI